MKNISMWPPQYLEMMHRNQPNGGLKALLTEETIRKNPASSSRNKTQKKMKTKRKRNTTEMMAEQEERGEAARRRAYVSTIRYIAKKDHEQSAATRPSLYPS